MSLYMDHFRLMIPTMHEFWGAGWFCAVILRFTNDVAVSVDMMFQMVRCMGFDLHYHEVRKLMYLVEAGLHQHASRCFIQNIYFDRSNKNNNLQEAVDNIVTKQQQPLHLRAMLRAS